jgi:arylformamidase
VNASGTPDLNAEYAGPAMAQEHRRIIDIWDRDAAAYRAAARARAQLDLVYGTAPRQRIDLFPPEIGASGPVALFIHGGYWQTMSKASFSHMARGANAHGVTVAVAQHTLCPDVTLSRVVDEVRAAVAFVVRRFGKPVTVCGHSAGGHLAACMLATNWRMIDPAFGAGTVRAGLPISGIFELEPLVSTTLNKRLRLDAAEARRLSPASWRPPAGKTMVAYVGGDESSEFLRQTRAMVAKWAAAGVDASAVEVAGQSHFSVISALAEPESAMTRDLVRLAGS